MKIKYTRTHYIAEPSGSEIFFNTKIKYVNYFYHENFPTTVYYTVLSYAILYYTILYYTMLYYTILYYTIRESVDSLCRDGADAQYMQYLSKSRITSPQTRKKLI